MSGADAGAFWRTEPIPELNQCTGSLPYGLYPAIMYESSTHPVARKHPYGRERVWEMVQWAVDNCRDKFTYSDRYGSFFFATPEDRTLFRLFFSDETMPEPDLSKKGW